MDNNKIKLLEVQAAFGKEAQAQGNALGATLVSASKKALAAIAPAKASPRAALKSAIQWMSVSRAEAALEEGARLEGSASKVAEFFDTWRVGAPKTEDRAASQAMAAWLAKHGVPLCHTIGFADFYGISPAANRKIPDHAMIPAMLLEGGGAEASARMAVARHWIWQWDGFDPTVRVDLLEVLESWSKDEDASSRIELAELAEHAQEHAISNVFNSEESSEEDDSLGIDHNALCFCASIADRFGIGLAAQYWPKLLSEADWLNSSPPGGFAPENMLSLLKASSEKVDPWSSGLLMGTALWSDRVDLLLAISERADAIHWRVPVEAWGMLDLYCEEERPLPALYLALGGMGKTPGAGSWDIIASMLGNEVLVAEACEHPVPEALAGLSVKAVEAIFAEEPRILLPNHNGENLAHIWADQYVTGKCFEIFMKITKGPLLFLLFQENKAGISPWNQLRLQLIPSDRLNLDEQLAALESKIIMASSSGAGKSILRKASRPRL